MSPKVQAAIALVIGAGLVILGAVAAYGSFRDYQLQSAYASAPSCASLADALAGSNCRYVGLATVASTANDAGTLNVYFPAADTTLIARFSPYAQTGGYSPDGTKVELWARRVTRVDDAITTDNPESLPPGILAGMSAMLVGLGLGVILWFLLVARRRGFRREDEPSSPVGVMGPVAASDVLWR